MNQPPRCLRPGCAQAVAPISRPRRSRTYRLTPDGVRWRDYCSPACRLAGFLAFNDDRYRARTRKRLEQDIAPLAIRYGIPTSELARVIWNAELRGYRRGFSAGWDRRRRKAIA